MRGGSDRRDSRRDRPPSPGPAGRSGLL